MTALRSHPDHAWTVHETRQLCALVIVLCACYWFHRERIARRRLDRRADPIGLLPASPEGRV